MIYLSRDKKFVQQVLNANHFMESLNSWSNLIVE